MPTTGAPPPNPYGPPPGVIANREALEAVAAGAIPPGWNAEPDAETIAWAVALLADPDALAAAGY